MYKCEGYGLTQEEVEQYVRDRRDSESWQPRTPKEEKIAIERDLRVDKLAVEMLREDGYFDLANEKEER
ncbi:MAG: hypothetical protein Q4A55_03565 [Aerococcus sp.]|nr:hypothetical protein [Aerococcus sp.]